MIRTSINSNANKGANTTITQEDGMNNRKSLTTRKFAAQFYSDMSKYLLLLLCAYGLFGANSYLEVARPIYVVLILIFAISAAGRAQCNLDSIDEEERLNHVSPGLTKPPGADVSG